MSKLHSSVGSLDLATPVIAAAGTYGYGLEYDGLVDWSLVGGVAVKGLSAKANEGYPAPRMVETPAGVLNAIGLQNIGAKEFVSDKLPSLSQLGPAVIANCWGNTLDEYVEVAQILGQEQAIDALEVNVSCPHKHEWEGILSTDLEATRAIVAAVRKVTPKPLWVKLSPNVTDITEAARVAEGEGADAIVAINTLRGLCVDIKTRRPMLSNGSGGLSGPAIKPVALFMVREIVRAVSIPVVGVGGIGSGSDAAEFLLAGASAVEIGTACLYDPAAPARIARELSKVLDDMGEDHVAAIIGALRES